MQIAMATRDRPFDVTTAPADVSKRVMEAVWCGHTRKSRYSTASAVLCTLGGSSLHPEQFCLYIQASKRPRSSATAKRGRGSVPTGSKRRLEERKTVATWRTRYEARLEAAEMLESRLEMLVNQRHRIQLDSFDDLLFVYHVYCLFFA